LSAERDDRGLSGVEILGPTPAFIGRLRGRYRYQLLLRGDDPGRLVSQLTLPRGWVVDIDPVGLA
ncbi:MAG: primosomal protein, partial [Dehalococcoidia bacterium]|nr:primosomal protein [Dehalococcoidia bacterium]